MAEDTIVTKPDRIIIYTENPQYDGEPIEFYINPSHATLSQQIYKTFKKMRKGFTKSYVGNGPVAITFSGSVPCNPNTDYGIATLATVRDDNVKNSLGWQWFQYLEHFIRENQGYLFRMKYLGTPIQFSVENPVFVGDFDIPSYDQDAENPFMISYSLTFSGDIVNNETGDAVINQEQAKKVAV